MRQEQYRDEIWRVSAEFCDVDGDAVDTGRVGVYSAVSLRTNL